MTHEDLFKLHHELCEAAFGIMQKKNADYSAGDGDPFFNFRGSQVFNVEPEIGTMIRMQDKFMRVMAFIVNGTLAVNDEGLMDIGHDLINYTVLLIGMAKDRADEQELRSEQLQAINNAYKRPRDTYPIPENWFMLPDGEMIHTDDKMWNDKKGFITVGRGLPAGRVVTSEDRANGMPCIIRYKEKK